MSALANLVLIDLDFLNILDFVNWTGHIVTQPIIKKRRIPWKLYNQIVKVVTQVFKFKILKRWFFSYGSNGRFFSK